MNVRIDNFHGIQPRTHPSLLPLGMAVRAHNCRLKNGKIVPLRRSAPVKGKVVRFYGGLTAISEANSIHVWKHFNSSENVTFDFLAFKGMTWTAEGNIADDKYDRVFVTGDTGVDFTDSSGNTFTNTPSVFLFSRSDNTLLSPHTLVKDKMPPPSVSLEGSVDSAKTSYYSFFYVSWFDEFGYESGLSDAAPASSPLEFNDGSTLKVSGVKPPKGTKGVRVYMTMSGSGGESGYDYSTAGIQFLYEKKYDETQDGTQTDELTFSIDMSTVGEAAPDIEPIPFDLIGMIYVAGGFYCGFSKKFPKTVMFSDIGAPTNWPIAYRYDVKDNIVALATTGNSVFVLTDGWPWLISGTAPESMTATKLGSAVACISPRSVCVHEGVVYFVSHDGVMCLGYGDSGASCVNITQKIFTKEQWQELNPESCLMGVHDGALRLFFTTKSGEGKGLNIDLSESENAVTTHDQFARCLCVDYMSDKMFFV